MKTSIITCLFIFFALLEFQAQNKEMDSNTESPYLLGEIDKDGLTSKNYNAWFSEHYEDYALDEAALKTLATALKPYEITLFMGTWCGDSKREVPRFYKILEACNYPMDQLTVIAVSRESNMYKQSSGHEERGLNIHRVPTFIFYKNGKEVNRIVESPVKTLEQDILNIVTSNSYLSNYQIVAKVNEILENKGINKLKRQSKKLVKAFDGKVTSMFELNTYGRILYTTDRTDAAIEVFRLNTKLFPDNPRTYMSLANILGISGASKKGIKVIEKAIKLFPENTDLVENLATLKTQ